MKQHRSGKEKHTEKHTQKHGGMHIKSYPRVCVCACPFLQSSRPTNKDYIKILLSPPFPLPARVRVRACACACVWRCKCVLCSVWCSVVFLCGCLLCIFPAVRPVVNHTKVCPESRVCPCVPFCVPLCSFTSPRRAPRGTLHRSILFATTRRQCEMCATYRATSGYGFVRVLSVFSVFCFPRRAPGG